MPYIVTTYSGTDCEGGTALHLREQSRRAVATLDEARRLATGPVYGARIACQVNGAQEQALYAECEALPESGGTVGPLPDGTVIEVERVEWEELEDELPKSEAAIIDAYNAAQKG